MISRLGAEPRCPRAGAVRDSVWDCGALTFGIGRVAGGCWSRRFTYGTMRLRALATALLLMELFSGFAEGGIISGGAGNGLLFQGQRSDQASVYLTAPGQQADSKAVTIEFWLNKIDKHFVHVPFSYFSSDEAVSLPRWPTSSQTFMYEVGEYGVWKFVVAGALFDCPRPNCSFGWVGGWQHVAMVLNAGPESGYVKAYSNGLLVFDSSLLDPPVVSFRPMVFPGVLVLGQVRAPHKTANLAILCTATPPLSPPP